MHLLMLINFPDTPRNPYRTIELQMREMQSTISESWKFESKY